LKSEGLFRVSPKTREVVVYRDAIDNGETVDFKALGPHIIGGIIKYYLRELIEPVIPYDLFEAFQIAGGNFLAFFFCRQLQKCASAFPLSLAIEDEQGAVVKLKELLTKIPSIHLILLKRLVFLLAKVRYNFNFFFFFTLPIFIIQCHP
jgi:hypothetical protein